MNPLHLDLDHVLERGRGLWPDLRGCRIFVTGGTGFFGRWLLESFLWANARLDTRIEISVLTRNPERFRASYPHLADDPAVTLVRGDILSCEFPDGHFDLVIHAATEASPALNTGNPLLMLDTIVTGTRRALDMARRAGAGNFLLTSSGAVYGRQPSELTHVPEDYPGGPSPLDPLAAYGEGKRAAEFLCSVYAHGRGLAAKVARCFAFVGPYLPLDAHFAVGNFIRDALGGGPIRVNGDGTPFRSYLYAADLVVWLLTVALRGKPARAYNVGSDEAVSIADLARAVARCADRRVEVEIAGTPKPGVPPLRYVPSIQRAREELGLAPWIGLEDGVKRTMAWARSGMKGTTR